MYKIYKIIDGIYLSNLLSAHKLELIKNNNIKLVIRLSEDDNNKSVYDNSIQFINIEIEDNFMDQKKLIPICKNIFNIINSFDGNILIHCNEGQSRSVSVILYYLMKQYKYKFNDAYDYIKKIKHDIHINSGFIQELKSVII
jgi:protein-tyrosine phosphatase